MLVEVDCILTLMSLLYLVSGEGRGGGRSLSGAGGPYLFGLRTGVKTKDVGVVCALGGGRSLGGAGGEDIMTHKKLIICR